MKRIMLLLTIALQLPSYAQMPSRFDGLLDYVQPGPDQGKTGACLFVASTGAMELLANKLHDIRDPEVFGPYDLSEPFLIHAPYNTPRGKSFFEAPMYKFNQGFAISAEEWMFVAWHEGRVNLSAWENQDYSRMAKIEVPQIETIKIFESSNRWATGVLNLEHVHKIKEALIKYESPILINYNDNNYWHVILVVGFDDRVEGDCYQTPLSDCRKTTGSFYVRDSFGKIIELRDYDWFIGRGNSAFVVKTL